MNDTDAEASRQRAIERLDARADEARAKASDRYWSSGPFNVQRWVERAYRVASAELRKTSPEQGEAPDRYLSRMAGQVRAMRDDGPDADDEGWYAGAIDDAAATITAD